MKGWVYAPFHVDTMLQAAVEPAKARTHAGGGRDRSGSRSCCMRIPRSARSTPSPTACSCRSFRAPLALRFLLRPGRDRGAATATINKRWSPLGSAPRCCCSRWPGCWPRPKRARSASRGHGLLYRRSEQRFRSMRYLGIGKALLDARGNIVEVNLVHHDRRSRSGTWSATVGGLADTVDSEPLRTAQMNPVLDEQDRVVHHAAPCAAATATCATCNSPSRRCRTIPATTSCAWCRSTTSANGLRAESGGAGAERDLKRGSARHARASARPTASWNPSPTASRTTCARRCGRSGLQPHPRRTPCRMGWTRPGATTSNARRHRAGWAS